MKPILISNPISLLLMVICGIFTAGNSTANEPFLIVTIVTGEHSRDSNSTTSTLTVTADKLVYQQSYHGAHSGGRTPVRKEYKLSPAERENLINTLQDKKLLVTRTLATLSPEQGSGFYFSLVISSKLNGKENSITINLPREAPKLKADRLYQDSVYLVQELYRIINRTDPEISMPELIH